MKTLPYLISAVLMMTLTSGCARPLPILSELPDFEFQEASGTTVTKRELEGKVWVADFIYTACPDICSLLTLRMKGLQENVSRLKKGPDVRLVSLTVDPEIDTVDRLSLYRKDNGIDSPHWYFLTGPLGKLEKTVVEGFKVSMGRDVNFQVFHSDRLILVDRRGRIRGYFESNKKGLQSILAGIRQLLEED